MVYTLPLLQLLFPLIFTNMIGAVDVEATVAGGGPSGQSGAIRWGIAHGLRSFVTQDVVEKMRIGKLNFMVLMISSLLVMLWCT